MCTALLRLGGLSLSLSEAVPSAQLGWATPAVPEQKPVGREESMGAGGGREACGQWLSPGQQESRDGGVQKPRAPSSERFLSLGLSFLLCAVRTSGMSLSCSCVLGRGSPGSSYIFTELWAGQSQPESSPQLGGTLRSPSHLSSLFPGPMQKVPFFLKLLKYH